MIVSVTQPSRPYADLADLTTKEITERGWETDADGTETYAVHFAVNLSAAEVEAVRRRLGTGSQVEETLHERAVAAYQDLQAFENLSSPTNAQTLAAVRLLCKVVRGLIRLQLRRLDSVE